MALYGCRRDETEGYNNGLVLQLQFVQQVITDIYLLGGLLSMLLALIIMQLFYTTTVTTHIARTLQVIS